MARRRVHGAAFKARAALAALKGGRSLGQLAGQFSVAPTQIAAWRRRLLEAAPELFEDRRRKRGQDVNEEELYEQIGRLKMEVEWLKKKTAQFE